MNCSVRNGTLEKGSACTWIWGHQTHQAKLERVLGGGAGGYRTLYTSPHGRLRRKERTLTCEKHAHRYRRPTQLHGGEISPPCWYSERTIFAGVFFFLLFSRCYAILFVFYFLHVFVYECFLHGYLPSSMSNLSRYLSIRDCLVVLECVCGRYRVPVSQTHSGSDPVRIRCAGTVYL